MNNSEFPAIGSSFTYLGLEFVVKSHKELIGMCFFGGPQYADKVVCEYADKNGVIREKAFWPNELRAIL